MISAAYEQDTLHKLWAVEMNLFHEFSRICRKNHLHFYGAYGTALGAIRHHGFIPWDDDMDFCMPRCDYEKFVRIARREIQYPYEILEPRITDGYVMPFAKLVRRDSTFVEATDENRIYHSGIFIDIFPLDTMPADRNRRLHIERKCFILARLMVMSEYKDPKIPENISGIKRNIIKSVCKTGTGLMELFGITKQSLYRKYIETVASGSKWSRDAIVTDLTSFGYEGNYHEGEELYRASWLFPVSYRSFDGEKMPLPADPDRYLRTIYGDYMELPPENKRHCHFPSELIFPKEI